MSITLSQWQRDLIIPRLREDPRGESQNMKGKTNLPFPAFDYQFAKSPEGPNMSTIKSDYYTPYLPKPVQPTAGYTQLVPFKYGHAKQIMVLKNDPHCSESIRLTGEFSPLEVRVFEKFIKPGDVVIDAGALFGEHTLPMAELVGPEGWVYAFEPQRIPFQILCGNVALNSIENVIARQCALQHGEAGYVWMRRLETHKQEAWGMNRTLQFTDACEDTVTIDCSYLDAYKYHKPFRFLKVDVEGDEPKVLLGAENSLQCYRPVVYLEFQSNQQDIVAILRSRGYSRLYLHKAPADPRDTGVPMLLALPPGKEVEDEWLREMGFQSV